VCEHTGRLCTCTYSHGIEDLTWSFLFLFILEVYPGCIWSDVLGILLNINLLVNGNPRLVDNVRRP
jgi:hypothetical protein